MIYTLYKIKNPNGLFLNFMSLSAVFLFVHVLVVFGCGKWCGLRQGAQLNAFVFTAFLIRYVPCKAALRMSPKCVSLKISFELVLHFLFLCSKDKVIFLSH